MYDAGVGVGIERGVGIGLSVKIAGAGACCVTFGQHQTLVKHALGTKQVGDFDSHCPRKLKSSQSRQVNIWLGVQFSYQPVLDGERWFDLDESGDHGLLALGLSDSMPFHKQGKFYPFLFQLLSRKHLGLYT